MHSSPDPSTAVGATRRRRFLVGLATTSAGVMLGGRRSWGAEGGKPAELAFARSSDSLNLTLGPRTVLRYQLKRPGLGGASSESACYVHPLCTPSGLVVTEVGPDDHRHHRGLFCGWVEMRGAAEADFWGWGEHAPTQDRRIVNTLVESPRPELGFARFRAVNHWMAGNSKLLTEDTRMGVALREGATVLDVSSRYEVEADLTLARWAFGGFAVRCRKEGAAKGLGPAGGVGLPAPKHTEPASNWPESRWYGLQLSFPDGKRATVVVVGRVTNPASTWHVVPEIGLINPSITAGGAVRWEAGKPVVLRYRVMAFDGTPDLALVNRLADAWFEGKGG